MLVATAVERMTPNTSNGYGVKVTFTYTSFDKKEIDFIEEQARKITNKVAETTADNKSSYEEVNVDDA